jgi:hypothetical protein
MVLYGLTHDLNDANDTGANQMARDFDEEIRKLRLDIRDIDNAIWYFERLETELAVKAKRPGKTGGRKSGTLLQMKRKAGTD